MTTMGERSAEGGVTGPGVAGSGVAGFGVAGFDVTELEVLAVGPADLLGVGFGDILDRYRQRRLLHTGNQSVLGLSLLGSGPGQ